MKNNIIVCPDIHGRKFWKTAQQYKDDVDKIIFLGDYVDPYGFENISVEESIENFKDIMSFVEHNKDKVILLLGNHDMPYFSKEYRSFSDYHCRFSWEHKDEISKIFNDNKDLFNIAYTYDDILFTHAGCVFGWIDNTFGYDYDFETLDVLVKDLNGLLRSTKGLSSLYNVSLYRGGIDSFGSCIWADIDETRFDQKLTESEDYKICHIQRVKQIFGHTLQAYYSKMRISFYWGAPIEYKNIKMIDNAHAYFVNTEEFSIKQINNESDEQISKE